MNKQQLEEKIEAQFIEITKRIEIKEIVDELFKLQTQYKELTGEYFLRSKENWDKYDRNFRS